MPCPAADFSAFFLCDGSYDAEMQLAVIVRYGPNSVTQFHAALRAGLRTRQPRYFGKSLCLSELIFIGRGFFVYSVKINKKLVISYDIFRLSYEG